MQDQVLEDIQKRFVLSLAVFWIMVLAVLPFTKITISYDGFADVLHLSLFISCFGLLSGRFGFDLLRSLTSILAGLFMILLPLVTANYMAMSLNMPLADDFLSNMDVAIGFDWHAFIAFVDEKPLLAGAFTMAYQSFIIQIVAAPVLLIFLGYHRRAHAFMIAFGLLTLLAAFIAIWFPAYGSYFHYGYVDGQLANINTYFSFEFIDHFEAVRNKETFHVSSDAISGILTFPSVHAGAAYLLIWATWPNVWLRYPFLLINIAMALSAVVNANHYLVDIIASVPLAAVCIMAVNAVFGRSSERADLSVASSSSTAYPSNKTLQVEAPSG